MSSQQRPILIGVGLARDTRETRDLATKCASLTPARRRALAYDGDEPTSTERAAVNRKFDLDDLSAWLSKDDLEFMVAKALQRTAGADRFRDAVARVRKAGGTSLSVAQAEARVSGTPPMSTESPAAAACARLILAIDATPPGPAKDRLLQQFAIASAAFQTGREVPADSTMGRLIGGTVPSDPR